MPQLKEIKVDWIDYNINNMLYDPDISKKLDVIEEDTLKSELLSVEGGNEQNLESGRVGGNSDTLSKYTNRIFGAPYQFLDSVDMRFSNINKWLGNEYMRDFMLNSPILYVIPGMPHYTGKEKTTSFMNTAISTYFDTKATGSFGYSLLHNAMKNTIFGAGSRLQQRMFGFRETYYEYMQNVNYMCRSCATFLSLTSGSEFPNGTFTGDSTWEPFESIYWENYRMMTDSNVERPAEYLGNVIQSLFHIGKEGEEKSLSETISGKVSCVQFMVEPTQFSESHTNVTEQSAIEQAIDAVGSDIGSEVAFFTNSNIAPDVIADAMKFLGDGVQDMAMNVKNMMGPITGGFVSSLFNGALGTIKGQKMIYPEIYKRSNSSMSYNFEMTLTTPYGDVYNYYMNIVVPILHLLALVCPRMVTSNSITSPFLVQAYIPGMATVNLGIVEEMTLTKNPTGKHVSVNGFPLTVKVSFKIKELYNSMSISPANNPVSFLYNETLNDYLCNLSGVVPSYSTMSRQRLSAFKQIDNYISLGAISDDILSGVADKLDNIWDPRL